MRPIMEMLLDELRDKAASYVEQRDTAAPKRPKHSPSTQIPTAATASSSARSDAAAAAAAEVAKMVMVRLALEG